MIESPPSARTFWRRGAPATFAVHVAQTSLAVVVASAWSSALTGAWGGHADGPRALMSGAILVETLHALSEGWAARGLVATIGAAIVWWLLGLPLQLWWLEAMRRPAPAHRRLARALARVPHALGATALWALAMGAVLALALTAPALWWVAFREHPDPRWADVGGGLLLLPALAAAFLGAAWHDTTRAAIVAGRPPLEALAVGWRERRAGAYVAWMGGAHALAAAATLAQGPDWFVLLEGQLLLLAARFARAAWLASALARVVPREAGSSRMPV